VNRTRTVIALGTAQMLAWGSSFYLPAMLAAPMARELGLAVPTVFALFSMALIVSAAAGPPAGRLIDRHGGRPVLIAANLIFAAGLVLLGLAQGPWSLGAGWVLIGLAMGGGLYEGAFAALVRLYGAGARNAITGVTLFGGFASTAGWPLSALMEAHWGWRGACFGWAALHLLLGAPLNALLPRAPAAPTALHSSTSDIAPAAPPPPPRHAAALLSLVFTLQWFVSTAMAAHLPTLVQALGGTLALAVAVGAMVGPAQVAGRLLEFTVLRRFSPLQVARAALLTHPLGAGLVGLAGVAAAAPFVMLHGLGSGILTIAKGTLPLAFFGPSGYGARQGWLMLPGRLLQGLAPWLFGLALAQWGAGVLWLSGGLQVAAFAALMMLHLPRPASTSPAAH
jgi:predicted MFS family arabinose efflux permease